MEEKRRLPRTIVLALVLTLPTLAPAKTLYVDANAPGLNDGSSWSSAYRYLQDALADAEAAEKPVEIRVAQGVYRPDRSSAHPEGTRDRKASFCLLDEVALKGGFAGFGASDPNARDIARYESVLSGDLAGDDVPVADPCHLVTEPTRTENSYTIVTASPCGRSAVLDGFTITGAHEEVAGSHSDGALSLPANAGPSVRNCSFVGNVSFLGGAVRVFPPTQFELIDCTFLKNVATTTGGAVAVSASRSSISGTDGFVIRRCTFAWNSILPVDEYFAGGGAISIQAGHVSAIEDCLFVGNKAERGGAIQSGVEGRITNCRFVQNTAEKAGGALHYLRAEVQVVSCTFFANQTPSGRACYVDDDHTKFAMLSIANSILWDGGGEIGLSADAVVDVTYSDVQSGWSGKGNLNVDPLFANPIPPDPNAARAGSIVCGDYHLKS